MANIDWVAIDGDINHDGVGGNYGGSNQPSLADAYRFGVVPPIAGPDSDGGAARSWGSINLISGAGDWFEESNSAFQKLDLEIGLSIEIDITGGDSWPAIFLITSVNGTASNTSGRDVTLIVSNQKTGKTCTPSGAMFLSVLSGVGNVAYTTALNSGARTGQLFAGSFTGIISVDTIEVELAPEAVVSATAISKLAFTNGGILDFKGPDEEPVWCGFTNATPTTGRNWSLGGVPTDRFYIDSRIKIGGSTLASLDRLPLTWNTTQTLNVAVIIHGGDKSYSWPNTIVDLGVVASVANLTIKSFGSSAQTCPTVSGVFTFTYLSVDSIAPAGGSLVVQGGDNTAAVNFNDASIAIATIGTDYDGALVNDRADGEGAGIVNLNGSVVSENTFANMIPTPAYFTNFTVEGGGGTVGGGMGGIIGGGSGAI